jgi:hypothetical protein
MSAGAALRCAALRCTGSHRMIPGRCDFVSCAQGNMEEA